MLYWKYKGLMPDMKRIFYILLLMINIGVFAQEKQHLIVDSRGVGTTPDAALKDALSQAVQQASGTLVDAKTIVKNEEIMEDRILAASDGFIQSYEKYGEARKNRQGLWTIRIRASVVMKPLKQKLIESRILVQNVGNSAQNQWAQIVSKESSQQDVPALLENLLKKYPIESMLKVYVFDDKGRFENLKLYFPQKGRVRDGKVKVSMGVLAVVDIEKYRKQLLPELLFLLDKVAPQKSRPVWNRGKSSSISDIRFGLSTYNQCINTGEHSQESRVVLIPSGRCYREEIQQLTSIPEGKIRLAVNISKGKYRSNVQKFQIYTFNKTEHLLKNFKKILPDGSFRKDLKIRLSFFDKDENLFFFKDQILLGHSRLLYHNYVRSNGFMITPEFDYSQSAKIFTFDCDIPLADLKEIAKVSASIVNGND